MGRRKNKSKRKQKLEDENRDTSSERPPNPSPELSDVDEGPSLEDIVRVPPVALECSRGCRPNSPIFSTSELSLMRYLTRRPGRQSRILATVPLNHIEPLVAYNRRMARVAPRSLVGTPQEQERRERAALLCPCRRVPSAREGGQQQPSGSRAPTNLPNYKKFQRQSNSNGSSNKTKNKQKDKNESKSFNKEPKESPKKEP